MQSDYHFGSVKTYFRKHSAVRAPYLLEGFCYELSLDLTLSSVPSCSQSQSGPNYRDLICRERIQQ